MRTTTVKHPLAYSIIKALKRANIFLTYIDHEVHEDNHSVADFTIYIKDPHNKQTIFTVKFSPNQIDHFWVEIGQSVGKIVDGVSLSTIDDITYVDRALDTIDKFMTE